MSYIRLYDKLEGAMTSVTPVAASESAIGRQITKSTTLVDEVTTRISTDIERGLFAPGARLPTEKEMMLSMGVSRTVVREAIAQLRARGLVNTRQGYGAYVAEDALVRPLHITVPGAGALKDTLHLVELRIAIEVEGAALAAVNATREDLALIDAAQQKVAEAIHDEGFGVAEDFAFHRQIAIATKNPHFPRILDFLGQHMIPRTKVQFSEEARLAYENLILNQHQQIFRCLVRGDEVEARNAVRQHLDGARRRYAEASEDPGRQEEERR
jgi:DNA-binding FadR family transcriptional regulator